MFTVGTVYLLLATQTSLNPSSKRVASSFASAQSCVDYLREMPWGCSRQSAAMLSRLIDEWAPPTAVSDVAKDPVSLAQQALDPGSTLAQQLRALGWTPPTAVSGEGAPLAAAAAPVPSTSQAVPASVREHRLLCRSRSRVVQLLTLPLSDRQTLLLVLPLPSPCLTHHHKPTNPPRNLHQTTSPPTRASSHHRKTTSTERQSWQELLSHQKACWRCWMVSRREDGHLLLMGVGEGLRPIRGWVMMLG